MRDLLRAARRIRDAAGRAYIRQQMSKQTRAIRRETDEEIRRALAELRAHDMGSPAFD